MVTVLPKENDWGEAFSSIGKGITEGYMNRADEMALQKAYKELPENATGDDVMKAILGVRTYSPERKQEFVKNVQEHEKTKASLLNQTENKRHNQAVEEAAIAKLNKPPKVDQKEIDKIEAAEVGLGTIEEMKAIRNRGNIGRGSGIIKKLPYIGEEAAKDSGRYEQLGKSLIQLSTNIPIRNRQEFEALAHGLYDPTMTDAEAEGLLDGLESFLIRTLGKKEENKLLNKTKEEGKEPTKRPPLSSFKKG